MLDPDAYTRRPGARHDGSPVNELPEGDLAVRPIYLLAESPGGPVLGRCGEFPDDDTRSCWLDVMGEAAGCTLGDLFERWGNDLVCYLEPEVVGIELVPVADAAPECECRWYPELDRDQVLGIRREAWSRWARTATTDDPPEGIFAHVPHPGADAGWSERRPRCH